MFGSILILVVVVVVTLFLVWKQVTTFVLKRTKYEGEHFYIETYVYRLIFMIFGINILGSKVE